MWVLQGYAGFFRTSPMYLKYGEWTSSESNLNFKVLSDPLPKIGEQVEPVPIWRRPLFCPAFDCWHVSPGASRSTAWHIL